MFTRAVPTRVERCIQAQRLKKHQEPDEALRGKGFFTNQFVQNVLFWPYSWILQLPLYDLLLADTVCDHEKHSLWLPSVQIPKL